MNTLPLMYSVEEMEDLQAFIEEHFGESQDLLLHEIQSEYVHTDTAVVRTPADETAFVTFGISARPMTAPLQTLSRCELVAYASPSFNAKSNDGRVIGGELTRLGRFPFANDTWFGEGHTIDASDLFRDTFGYDAFLFLNTHESYIADVNSCVRFLALLPIYAEERQYIMENGSSGFLAALLARDGDSAMHADVRRDPVSAEEAEEAEVTLTPQELCGIDDAGLGDFLAFLKEAEEEGFSLTEDDIARWIEEHEAP